MCYLLVAGRSPSCLSVANSGAVLTSRSRRVTRPSLAIRTPNRMHIFTTINTFQLNRKAIVAKQCLVFQIVSNVASSFKKKMHPLRVYLFMALQDFFMDELSFFIQSMECLDHGELIVILMSFKL